MCLDKITLKGAALQRQYSNRLTYYGYKVMWRNARTSLVFHTECTKHDLGVWYTDTKLDRIQCVAVGQSYQTGFHILDTFEGAQKYRDTYFGGRSSVIVGVQYRSIVAVGVQNDTKVVVARQMKINHTLDKNGYIEPIKPCKKKINRAPAPWKTAPAKTPKPWKVLPAPTRRRPIIVTLSTRDNNFLVESYKLATDGYKIESITYRRK